MKPTVSHHCSQFERFLNMIELVELATHTNFIFRAVLMNTTSKRYYVLHICTRVLFCRSFHVIMKY